MVGDLKMRHLGDLKMRSRPYYFRRCKSKWARPTSIGSLPNELLSDILLRLPADYLCDTARLVCRRWYHTIRSREFVHTQVQQSTYGFLLCISSTVYEYPFFMTAAQGRTETRRFSHSSLCPYFGSSNGLALKLDWESRLLQIINPATQEALALPSYRTRPFGIPITFCGIAYATTSMVYKVTVPHKDVDFYLSILTAGVDNSWREVEVEHLPRYARALITSSPLTTEGFIHYVGKGTEFVEQEHNKHVVTLDVETEILTVSEVPLANLGKTWHCLSTGRFLSMLVGHDDFSWEVWGMESRNGEWLKVLPDIDLGDHKCRLIQQFACGENEILEPLGWVNYPEVLALCFRGQSRTCIFYNLNTHQINSTHLHRSRGSGFLGIVHKNNLIRLT